MGLLKSLWEAVQGWRRRRSGPRPVQRTSVRLEQLDHRQLLSVTFTGNARADIPDNGPGTAILRNDDRVFIPDPVLRNLIKVSGFDVSAIRMKYTPDDDILSVALEQPGNQKTDPEFPVIAGDADNNGNGATVDPAVLAQQPLFEDLGYLGESETMFVFLDLTGDDIPDVVAGISNDPGAGKLYQVAQAVVNPDPVIARTTAPGFGTPLQDNTGFAFLRNEDPAAGAFEFQITNFSQLYLAETGNPLLADTVIGVGGFFGSLQDFIPELFLAARPVNFGVAPPVPPECPPISPPIVINPHQHRHVNTAHPNYVRVTFFGTSGFDVRRIIPGSIRLDGAVPAFHFNRNINHDEFLDATYVFRGDELDFPPGVVVARVTGLYNDPNFPEPIRIETSKIIFVNDGLNATPAQRAAQQRRLAHGDPLATIPDAFRRRAHRVGVPIVEDTPSQPSPDAGKPVVSIPLRPGSVRQAVAVISGDAKAAQSRTTPSRPTVTIPTRQAAAARLQARAAAAASAPAPNRLGGLTPAELRKQRASDLHDLAMSHLASR
jgi:hypothetical protein